jgi:prepilin-type N-terminal cleavage/methylation domain-containing protein
LPADEFRAEFALSLFAIPEITASDPSYPLLVSYQMMPAPMSTGPTAISPRTLMRRGFSLIELLTVITLIAIMAMIAMPRVRLERQQVDGAMRTLSMAMMVAQREAVARGHNVYVVIDTVHHVIRTVWDANNNNQLDAGEKTRPLPIPERVVMGRGATVPALNGATPVVPAMRTVAGMPAILLQRNGSTDRALTLYLTTVKARGGASTTETDTRAMKIERATGRAIWYVYTTSWKRN